MHLSAHYEMKMRKKKYSFAGYGIPKAAKIDALEAVYERGSSATELAARLTSMTGQKTKKTSVVNFYARNKKLVAHMPLRDERGEAPSVPKSRKLKPKQSRGIDMRLRVEGGRLIRVSDNTPLTKGAPQVGSKPPDSKKKKLLEMGSRQCRWATDHDGAHHLFCGNHTKPLKPYCDYHEAKSVQRSRSAEEAN